MNNLLILRYNMMYHTNKKEFILPRKMKPFSKKLKVFLVVACVITKDIKI